MSLRRFLSLRRNRFLLWWALISIFGIARMATDRNFRSFQFGGPLGASIGVVALAAALAFAMVVIAWLRTGRRSAD